MNREEQLNKTFPLEDGTTYVQNLDKSNEPKGAGVGGESIKENFIDSTSDELGESDEQSKSPKLEESASVDRDIDFMYKWIKGHKERK
jgi:hypothetical protein